MSANIDAVIGRALRDEAFRNQVLSNPSAVAAEYNLSSGEVAALKNISQEAADEFFSKVAGGRAPSAPWCTDKSCYERG